MKRPRGLKQNQVEFHRYQERILIANLSPTDRVAILFTKVATCRSLAQTILCSSFFFSHNKLKTVSNCKTYSNFFPNFNEIRLKLGKALAFTRDHSLPIIF